MGPLFKVGQKVTVKHRKKSEYEQDYPCSFVDAMVKFENTKVTIARVDESICNFSDRKFSCYHDGYTYRIKEDSNVFIWSSSMFQETYEL